MSGWEVLSRLVRALLAMSAAGGVMTLLLLAAKPLAGKVLTRSAWYYLWVLVLAAYLVPFSALVSLPFAAPMAPVQQALEENVKTSAQRREELAVEEYGTDYDSLEPQDQIQITFREIGLMKGQWNDFLLTALLTMGAVRFAVDLLEYAVYTGKLRRRRAPARAEERAMLQRLRPRGRLPRLYRNGLTATPILLGLFRPVIYLPEREYTAAQLENALRHELTHLRRLDVLVKWLAAAAVYLHWFNPLAYLYRRELDRACELACDEKVIRHLDAGGKQSYGDTLIDLAAGGEPRRIAVYTTLCQEKKLLKGRLRAIMESKTPGWQTLFFSGLALAGVLAGVVLLGSAGDGWGAGAARAGVEPYQLTGEESQLLQYFQLDGRSQILAFQAPEDARSVQVHVYRLKGEVWEETGGGAVSLGEDGPAKALKGVFTMTLEEGYDVAFNLILEDGGMAAYTADGGGAGAGEMRMWQIGFLREFAPIALGEEIPVALMVYDGGTQMRSFQVGDYFSPGVLEGMDLAQAVTLEFTV